MTGFRKEMSHSQVIFQSIHPWGLCENRRLTPLKNRGTSGMLGRVIDVAL